MTDYIASLLLPGGEVRTVKLKADDEGDAWAQARRACTPSEEVLNVTEPPAPKPALPWLTPEPPPPAERPRCKGGCGAVLKPNVYTQRDTVTDAQGTRQVDQGIVWGGYQGYDGFHSLRCAHAFAAAAYRAGYRIRS